MGSPSYLNLSKNGELARRAGLAYGAMRSCMLCPRNCAVNRLKNELARPPRLRDAGSHGGWGFCRTGKVCKVASSNLHNGEEPPISGTRGSGTIFFSNCNLRCVFCQNYPISQLGNGECATPHELADMMLRLQDRGAHNINLVTPSHVVAQFLAGLTIAAKNGLKIPIVYNCSGYDGLEALKLLDGVVDIYMPDIKYCEHEIAERYSGATKYWDAVRPAIKEMHRQVGPLVMDEDGIGVKGILIRHLVLPGGLSSSEKIFEFIATELSKDVPVNLMSQYFPAHKAVGDPVLGRQITKEEFKEAEAALHKWGLTEGWIQHM